MKTILLIYLRNDNNDNDLPRTEHNDNDLPTCESKTIKTNYMYQNTDRLKIMRIICLGNVNMTLIYFGTENNDNYLSVD